MRLILMCLSLTFASGAFAQMSQFQKMQEKFKNGKPFKIEDVVDGEICLTGRKDLEWDCSQAVYPIGPNDQTLYRYLGGEFAPRNDADIATNMSETRGFKALSMKGPASYETNYFLQLDETKDWKSIEERHHVGYEAHGGRNAAYGEYIFDEVVITARQIEDTIIYEYAWVKTSPVQHVKFFDECTPGHRVCHQSRRQPVDVTKTFESLDLPEAAGLKGQAVVFKYKMCKRKAN